MKKFSKHLLSLLLVLLSIGALDLSLLFDHAFPRPWPAASAAPIYSTPRFQVRSNKARVGIVLKSDSSLKSTDPINTITTGGSGGAFQNADGSGRLGMKLQLKMLQRDSESEPLLLYQRHINRATSKLAAILGRSPPTSLEMQQALERRKASILARRSSIPSSTPSSFLERGSHTNARQGYTSYASTPDGPEHQRRLLSSILDSIFGNTSVESGNKSKSTVASVSSNGYAEADFIASQTDNLTLASNPTAVQSVGLDIESNDIGYVATIQIGSQNTTFRMLIDSGSADTWVPKSTCDACGSTHQQLGPNNSDTFKALSTPFSIQYGTGDVSGNLAVDSFDIAGLGLSNFTFAVTTEESSDFSDSTVPFDGLMGLARSELSNAGQPTPIDALYEQGQVQAPVMGYHLGRVADGYNDGEVTFGGVDPAKYSGNITEIDNVSTKGFWEGSIDAVTVGGTDLDLQNRTAILDTGTTLIVAPQRDADAVHAQIPGSKSDGQGGYTIPCTTTKQVAFKFGGVVFPIDSRDMLFLPVDANDLKGECVSAISAGNVGQANEWLVGATFLKNVYFATNTKANVIGLAPLNTTNTAPSHATATSNSTSTSE
ncbi:related to extracellular aspartic proteinase [Melanopsichium pennsylvanicum]|uniref:Related to extracellular aspartic proteinase n=2 Tax=Melanopsichium pennsylvanicum TaxID=63383 RepID=A0AAJ4XK97_9BASI|nr:related to Rhizopuspepsin precursor [Melanopsichium pennsylvanicum 4]SNX84309.1 related to extracellular aspartic proteinase [Melanopsichium pennsylvanicum]